ncbi:hypothetical protein CDD82_2909 [Ophiocordyceps australis]|uniref:Tetratricopeptide repeat protein 36 n=1 Tax=Ophiocordyceps australis TaxID=1399860 RepID=A0A2C5ZF92_9HYPO|nr:hypothetical protein CDD82_2909 [Ophiocordyceps australis]
MAHVNLSQRDINVLHKIKDPESNPAAAVVTDPSLPRDPHVTDPLLYQSLVQQERHIISTLQEIEAQLNQSQAEDAPQAAVHGYRQCLASLDRLISEHPNYASARNNRLQVTRRLYGDAMLLNINTNIPLPLLQNPPHSERKQAALMALQDVDRCIALLSPATMSSPMSPQAAQTLSMSHTQRAAIYLATSKLLLGRSLDIDSCRPEAQWSRLDFEEAASRDLAYGGRYGNHIAKNLAVSVNPTAKLCGQIVREAMKKEYGTSLEI